MSMTLNETMDRLRLLIRSGYPVIYIVSQEESRVLDYLSRLFRTIRVEHCIPQDQRRERGKHLLRWQLGMGLREAMLDPYPAEQCSPDEEHPNWLNLPALDPAQRWEDRGAVDIFETLGHLISATTEQDPAPPQQANPTLGDSLVVFNDVHSELVMGGHLVRPVRTLADEYRKYYERMRGRQDKPYKTMVIVGPSSSKLSPELERDLISVEFPLPEEGELLGALNTMVEQKRLAFPAKLEQKEAEALFGAKAKGYREDQYREQLSRLIAGAGRGLTLEDYKLGLNGFAVLKRPLAPAMVEDMLNLKAKVIKSPAITYTPHVDVELGGLAPLMEYIHLRRTPVIDSEIRRKYRLAPAKGLMIAGPSGAGKSQSAKLIAKVFNLALLRLDVGALFGSYIGESEERTRAALQLAEVLAPVVLWMDEIDKAFAGAGAAAGDGGVSARVLGYFLTWMAEKKDTVYVVATANDFTTIIARFPEFARKGRFDECVWIGLPSPRARAEIFEIYLRRLTRADETGVIRLEESAVEQFVQNRGAGAQLEGNTPLQRFASLLSDNNQSQNMTGAEIEYAIQMALYESFKLDMNVGKLDTLMPELIFDAVRNLKSRALYSPMPGLELARLMALEADARTRGFLMM